MKTRRRTRKFADGGFSTAEGENKNISDDIRARALRSVMPDDSPAGTTGYGEQNDLPETKPVTVTKTKTSVTTAKPKADDSSEKERMEKRVKEQALERVEPENFIPGVGMLKGLLKGAVRSVEKDVARTVTNKAGKEIPVKQGKPDFSGSSEEVTKNVKAQTTRVANKARKSEEGFNLAEALKARKKAGMKAGGSVKSSQMSKANGIAQRGLTRGKMC
jgi:hypothetical protein